MGYLLGTILILGLTAVCVENQDVRLPPSITEQNEEIYKILPEGIEHTLTCVAAGSTPIEYEWKKLIRGEFHTLDLNDPNYELLPNSGSVKFIEFGPMDEGSYQCFAANSFGTALSNMFTLTRAVLAGYAGSSVTETHRVNVGQSQKVWYKRTKSVPDPNHIWSTVIDENDKDKRNIELSRRVQLDDFGNLFFSYVNKQDEKEGRLYECNVLNPFSRKSVYGSYARIIVNDTVPATFVSPSIEFYTGDSDPSEPVIFLKGETLQLRCLFSGKPEVEVSWTRVDGDIPIDRRDDPEKTFGTVLGLKDVELSDKGRYRCTGRNEESGTGLDHYSQQDIEVDIQSKPEFLSGKLQLANRNVTEGETAVFRCEADAIPSAGVRWYINGNPITDDDERPPRIDIVDGGLQLEVHEVCKNCLGGSSDLMVLQCNASNIHGSVFVSGYLNVLLETEITLVPEDVELVYSEEVRFACNGTSDDSTPISVTWYKNDWRVELVPGVVELEDDTGTVLKITTKDLDEKGLEFVGNYTCSISNGYSSASASARLIRPPEPPPTGDSVIDVAGGSWWWIILLVVLLLLLLLLLLICCLCYMRNRGDSYPVDDKEREMGNDPEQEIIDTGYHEFQRKEDNPVMKGSRASLSSQMKLDEDDTASMDFDAGNFNEDGSFVGMYNTIERRRVLNM